MPETCHTQHNSMQMHKQKIWTYKDRVKIAQLIDVNVISKLKIQKLVTTRSWRRIRK